MQLRQMDFYHQQSVGVREKKRYQQISIEHGICVRVCVWKVELAGIQLIECAPLGILR